MRLDRLCDEKATDIGHLLVSLVVDEGRILHQIEIDFAIRGLQAAQLSCQVHDSILPLVVIRGWLDEEVLLGLSDTVEAEVAKGWHIVRKNILIVQSDAAKLDDTIHLPRRRLLEKVFVAE